MTCGLESFNSVLHIVFYMVPFSLDYVVIMDSNEILNSNLKLKLMAVGVCEIDN